MKFIPCILFLVALYAIEGCERECKTYDQKPITGIIEEYFGVYKPGNWWTYRNQNGTAKDSIYVTDFTDVRNNNRTVCMTFQERRFTLKSVALNNTQDLFAVYNTDPGSVGIYFSNFNNQTIGAPFPFFRYDNDVKTLWSFPEGTANNFLDSIVLNSVTYFNILKGSFAGNNYYFSKNKGLVGWTTGSTIFNLINVRIQ